MFLFEDVYVNCTRMWIFEHFTEVFPRWQQPGFFESTGFGVTQSGAAELKKVPSSKCRRIKQSPLLCHVVYRLLQPNSYSDSSAATRLCLSSLCCDLRSYIRNYPA
eukprot:GHVU01205420.1.p2 GENE.GHVU01205420.1~~GHVU01205420.1.p2  ORF type:complete len:106 (+),score=4.98 GHVU01205420.1:2338-2655(+)